MMLDGKRVLVGGGGAGIGRELTGEFARTVVAEYAADGIRMNVAGSAIATAVNAHAARYPASDASSYVTGQQVVDGGVSGTPALLSRGENPLATHGGRG